MSTSDQIVEADNTPLPGSNFTPRQVRVLKIVVVVLGVLLVGGFLLIIGTIAYQASQMGGEEAAAPSQMAQQAGGEGSIDVPLPPGSEITGTTLEGTRLAVSLKTPDGPQILVLDLRRHQVISHIKLRPETASQ